jgi:hypothetical protein
MEQYIKHQLNRITKDTPGDQRVYMLNGIYAVLEEKGYKRSDISEEISRQIIGKLQVKKNDLKNLNDQL